MHKTLNLFLYTALFLALIVLLTSQVVAVEDSTITENIKKRLQNTIASESASLNQVKYRSFVGQITDVIKDTLIVEDKDGKKNIKIASGSAVVRSPGNTSIKTENIRIEDYVIAIGRLEAEDELESVRLIVSTEPVVAKNKTSDSSTITSLNKSSLVLASGQVVNVDKSTVIKSPLGELIDFSEFKIGDRLVYTGKFDDDELIATNLMRIGFASPEASSTPVASPKN